MIGIRASEESGRIVRRTMAVCAVGAGAALVVGTALGYPLAGVAVALGALIGGANGLLAKRLMDLGISFGTTSLLRLMVISGAALAAGLLLGFARVFLVVAGVAAAQLVLAGSATLEATRR